MCDINQHVTCKLCAGYLIDATTITECLHTCKFTYSIVVYISGHVVIVLSLCKGLVKNFIVKGNLFWFEIPV